MQGADLRIISCSQAFIIRQPCIGQSPDRSIENGALGFYKMRIIASIPPFKKAEAFLKDIVLVVMCGDFDACIVQPRSIRIFPALNNEFPCTELPQHRIETRLPGECGLGLAYADRPLPLVQACDSQCKRDAAGYGPRFCVDDCACPNFCAAVNKNICSHSDQLPDFCFGGKTVLRGGRNVDNIYAAEFFAGGT